MRGYEMGAREIQDRLGRIEGQVHGVRAMVERGEGCLDVLTQLNSISAAIRAVGFGLLDDHVRRCIAHGLERGPDSGWVDELVTAVARFAGRA